MSTAKSSLSVSAVMLAMLAAVVGALVGALLGGLIGGALASMMHVSSREGEAGYFVMLIVLIAIAIASPAAVLLTLYWRGVRRIWLLAGFLIAFAGVFLIGGGAFGAWYAMQPHVLNANGPTPQLQFEVRPPQGQSLDALTNAEVELNTDRNVMPGYWSSDAATSGAKAGYVEMYFRTSQRLLVLKFPQHEDRIYKLPLPANPMNRRYREWSEWKNPDFVAKNGGEPTKPGTSVEYQMRYRVDYQDR